MLLTMSVKKEGSTLLQLGGWWSQMVLLDKMRKWWKTRVSGSNLRLWRRVAEGEGVGEENELTTSRNQQGLVQAPWPRWGRRGRLHLPRARPGSSIPALSRGFGSVSTFLPRPLTSVNPVTELGNYCLELGIISMLDKKASEMQHPEKFSAAQKNPCHNSCTNAFKAWVMVKAEQQAQPGLNFFFLFLPPAFILALCSLCGDAQSSWRKPGWCVLHSDEFTQGCPADTISSHSSKLWASGQTQDAGGCEKGPGRWLAQSLDPMGKCVSASSINARLRAGSLLAQIFRVYCSYRTTLTKRGLHKWL